MSEGGGQGPGSNPRDTGGPSGTPGMPGQPADPTKYYRNPSIGLNWWGPLIPANDCTACLYTLTGVQLATGLALWTLPGRVFKPGRSMWRTRMLRTGGILGGSYLMLLSGLELVRLTILSGDPWYQDAKQARAVATRAGIRVLPWLGPFGYRAVGYPTWRKRMDSRATQAEGMRTRAERAGEVHADLRQRNREVSREILATLQRENEADPTSRENRALIELKEELNGSARSFPTLSKQPDNSEKKSSDDVEWYAIEPWDQLQDETNLSVRLMPHSRGIYEDASIAVPLDQFGDLGSHEPSGSPALNPGIDELPGDL